MNVGAAEALKQNDYQEQNFVASKKKSIIKKIKKNKKIE